MNLFPSLEASVRKDAIAAMGEGVLRTSDSVIYKPIVPRDHRLLKLLRSVRRIVIIRASTLVVYESPLMRFASLRASRRGRRRRRFDLAAFILDEDPAVRTRAFASLIGLDPSPAGPFAFWPRLSLFFARRRGRRRLSVTREEAPDYEEQDNKSERR
jgi:hypothetical protein